MLIRTRFFYAAKFTILTPLSNDNGVRIVN
jgi:hypothetical protein